MKFSEVLTQTCRFHNLESMNKSIQLTFMYTDKEGKNYECFFKM